MSGPRILHTSDSHIGAQLPARPRRRGLRRGDDFVRSFGRVLSRATEHHVDMVIHSGDLFDTPDPSAVAMTAAAAPLLELARDGIPVVIVPGNHERSSIPGSLLLAHENIHVVRAPCTLQFDLGGVRLAVAAFPCVRRGIASSLAGILEATGSEVTRADVHVLAMHQLVESAVCGPGKYRFGRGENVVDRGDIPRAFAYVAAGHVHRHQVLRCPRPGGSPIVYAGSPDRISFAEKDEPKGCVLVTFDGGCATPIFLEHDVRPMSVVPLDVTGFSREGIRDAVSEAVLGLPVDSVASIRLAGQSCAADLAGLGLTALARGLRLDVMCDIAWRGIEVVCDGGAEQAARRVRSVGGPSVTPGRGGAPALSNASTSSGCASLLAKLYAPDVRIVQRTAREVRLLPARCGAYALFDETDRLLYVGKSSNVRVRIQAHLRGSGSATFFDGWTDRIARVDFRPAGSELEALLVEAEMIRKFRPPFNQQMRAWSRYCYLCDGGGRDGAVISDEPMDGMTCLGPFRSRTFAEVVRDRMTEVGLAVLRSVRQPIDVSARRERVLDQFEQMRDYLVGLIRARGILDGVLALPGKRSAKTIAVVGRAGLWLDVVGDSSGEVERFLNAHREQVGNQVVFGDGWLPKSVFDCACTAVRQLDRHPSKYAFIECEVARGIESAEFRGRVFGFEHSPTAS